MNEIQKQYPPEKYFDIDDDMLAFMERNAETLVGQYRESFILQKQNAEKLATLMTTGISAVFVMLLNNLNSRPWTALDSGAAVLIVCWSICIWQVLRHCVQAQRVFMMHASPDNLFIPSVKGTSHLPVGKVRRYRLTRYDRVIAAWQRQNLETADRLNRWRLLSAVSVSVAAAACGLHYLILSAL